MNRLKELRERKNLTKKDIAKMIGVSDSIYARWEHEKDIIPTIRIYQLANFYEINIDYLLGLSSTKIKMTSSVELNRAIVSQRVREIRSDTNETLRKFAMRLNTSNSTWSAYETGKTLILCAFMIEICKSLNYSADWILGRSDIKFLNKNK